MWDTRATFFAHGYRACHVLSWVMGLVVFGFLSMPICPFTEVHPLLGVKGDGKSKKKQAGRPKGSKGKEKDSPFKPKLYKGDRGLPLEGSAKGKVQAELSQPLAGKDTLGALSGLLCGLALYSPWLCLPVAFFPSSPPFSKWQIVSEF